MSLYNQSVSVLHSPQQSLFLRDVVSQADEIDKTADTAAKMLAASDTYKDSIDRFFKEYVYNLGSSASVGAKYIIQEIQKAIKRHKEQE